MRRDVFFVAAALLGAVLLAGAATATPTTTDSTLNESDNGTQVGICMIGVDSPCNGEQWDGDDEPLPGDDETRESDGERIHPDDGANGSGDNESEVGICVIGTDSPCNADRWESFTSTPAGSILEFALEPLLGEL